MKTVVTITGIRPDFIRMAALFKRLDEEFNHILIHTGQHYDNLLSGIFFDELEIREPDYNLQIGAAGKEHFYQLGDVSVKSIELLREKNINPDIILFLGDSNSVASAISLKKEGYTIGHIEAGMRSGDKRMLEEINRTVCDHCSDFHFVYHDNYKMKLIKENLPAKNIYVVGNTIVEVCNPLAKDIMSSVKTKDFILMDIHRPENFKFPDRLVNIFKVAQDCAVKYNVPIKCLKFKRTMDMLDHLGRPEEIEFIDLMSYKDFLAAQYNCLFIISDSGTAQEEPALLNTPVIVPRDYTERPESMEAGCSMLLNVDTYSDKCIDLISDWLSSKPEINRDWLGDGTTSEQIIKILKERL